MKTLKVLNLQRIPFNVLRLLGFFILLSVFFSCEKGVHTIYVSSKQKLLQDGTVTLQQALDSVKHMHIKGYEGAIQVLLHAGTYSLSKPIVLTEAHSGNSTFPLVIAPAGDGEVIISGSQRLELDWDEAAEELWQAQISALLDFDQLYLNGKKTIRARYPNYDPTQRIYNGYAADAISPERIARWKNPSTGILHAMHVAEWGDYHYQIAGIDAKGKRSLKGVFRITGKWECIRNIATWKILGKNSMRLENGFMKRRKGNYGICHERVKLGTS